MIPQRDLSLLAKRGKTVKTDISPATCTTSGSSRRAATSACPTLSIPSCGSWSSGD